MRARGENKRTLHFVALEPSKAATASERPASERPRALGLYELDQSLQLRPVADQAALDYHVKNAAIAVGAVTADAASLVYTDDAGRRWRLPRSSEERETVGSLGPARICREVATERDLFNAGGTFFELPAENAGGFAKVRAVATHDRQIVDYCSYRGLFLVSGIVNAAPTSNPHIIRSTDGRTALWAGAIDDVWQFGRPRGVGGPWKNSDVAADEPSDPYLLSGYESRSLQAFHDSKQPVTFRIEVDITGTGLWIPFHNAEIQPGKVMQLDIPASQQAYWLRATASATCRATCQLQYGTDTAGRKAK